MLGAQKLEDRFALTLAHGSSETRVTQKSIQSQQRGRESPFNISSAPESVMIPTMPLPPVPLGVEAGGGGGKYERGGEEEGGGGRGQVKSLLPDA